MSKSNKAISEIKSLMVQFGFLKAEDATPLSFKLEDDTIIEVAELKAGEKVVKINEEFEKVSLEDGVYRLKENFHLEVKEGSIVAVNEIFLDAKTKDGQSIKVEGDALNAGAKVSVVTDAGEVPAPDGEWVLEDGTCVYTVGGVIDHVMEAAAEAASPEDVSGVAPGVEAPEGGVEVEVSGALPQEMVDMLKEFIVKCSEKLSEMEAKTQKMEAEFNAFKKEPAGKKISTAKSEFNIVNNSDNLVDNKIAAIMALRNNNKK